MKRPLEDKAYVEIVKDILENEEFRKTLHIEHHGENIYKHSIRVSYRAYKIALKSGLDHISVARGGLLHDFTVLHWKDTTRRFYEVHKMHGFLHPKVARENSLREFNVTDKEADIIVKHMFPLTITPPRYIESWLVSYVDKIIAAQEVVEDSKIAVKERVQGWLKRLKNNKEVDFEL